MELTKSPFIRQDRLIDAAIIFTGLPSMCNPLESAVAYLKHTVCHQVSLSCESLGRTLVSNLKLEKTYNCLFVRERNQKLPMH